MKKSILATVLLAGLCISGAKAETVFIYDMQGRPIATYQSGASSNPLLDVLKSMNPAARHRAFDARQAAIDQHRRTQAEIELLQLQIEQLRRGRR